ncbi:MAG TPA: hypothetical protein VL991_03595 [Terracidiphilus sp.]|nr:hypothetical protein [Terracidiphilus sp.]
MERTLREHIDYLEKKIEMLKKELQGPEQTPSQQNEIEIDLGIAERALAHFQRAFDFEQRLSHTLRSFKTTSEK